MTREKTKRNLSHHGGSADSPFGCGSASDDDDEYEKCYHRDSDEEPSALADILRAFGRRDRGRAMGCRALNRRASARTTWSRAWLLGTRSRGARRSAVWRRAIILRARRECANCQHQQSTHYNQSIRIEKMSSSHGYLHFLFFSYFPAEPETGNCIEGDACFVLALALS